MAAKQVLKVPGQYEAIRRICEFVSEGARDAGLDEDAVFHVELCCDEASTNIIEHAYGAESQGEITVTYEATGDEFKITLHDNGRAFDPHEVPPPSLPTVAEESSEPLPPDDVIDSLKVGGLGIYFMRNLMDEVYFDFDTHGGNTLILVKKIPKGSKQ